MRTPARVAVVGYGLGGSVFHAPLIHATEGLDLAAVVTSDPGRQAAARARYPGVRVLPGVEHLLGDPAEWDLVVVTTPNATHYALAEAALDAGIATVVDKPVTPTAAEAERLASVARARGVSVIPYHNRRWDGDYLTLCALVRDGRLGQVWRFESRFERWRPGPAAARSWKHDPALAGGGILYDLGSHLVDQALLLFGPPSSVYAEQARHTGPLDDDTFVALVHDGGPMVHLWVSSTAAQLGPRFRVLGSDAAYVKYGMDPQEEALRAGRVPDGPGWGEEPPEAWGRVGTTEPPEAEARDRGRAGTTDGTEAEARDRGRAGTTDGTEAVPTRPGAYPAFYAGVAAHLLRGAPPPVDVADAVAGLRVLEAASRSATSREVVRL